jgi:hypothetical protein
VGKSIVSVILRLGSGVDLNKKATNNCSGSDNGMERLSGKDPSLEIALLFYADTCNHFAHEAGRVSICLKAVLGVLL